MLAAGPADIWHKVALVPRDEKRKERDPTIANYNYKRRDSCWCNTGLVLRCGLSCVYCALPEPNSCSDLEV